MTVIAITVIVTQLPQMPHLQLWASLGILMTLCICIFICIFIVFVFVFVFVFASQPVTLTVAFQAL